MTPTGTHVAQSRLAVQSSAAQDRTGHARVDGTPRPLVPVPVPRSQVRSKQKGEETPPGSAGLAARIACSATAKIGATPLRNTRHSSPRFLLPSPPSSPTFQIYYAHQRPRIGRWCVALGHHRCKAQWRRRRRGTWTCRSAASSSRTRIRSRTRGR